MPQSIEKFNDSQMSLRNALLSSIIKIAFESLVNAGNADVSYWLLAVNGFFHIDDDVYCQLIKTRHIFEKNE